MGDDELAATDAPKVPKKKKAVDGGRKKKSSKKKAVQRPAKSAPHVRKVVRDLKVKLPDEDVAELGRELADAEEEFASITAEKKEAMAAFKERLSASRSRIDLLVEQINEGVEKEVECLVTADPDSMTLKVVRTDTDEVVEERAATAADFQATLID